MLLKDDTLVYIEYSFLSLPILVSIDAYAIFQAHHALFFHSGLAGFQFLKYMLAPI